MATISRLMEGRGGWRKRPRLRGDELVRAWGVFLGRIPWQFFATLTFREAVSFELASEEAFGWLCVAAYLCRRPVVWAYAVERGRDKLWHVHVVIAGAGEPNLKTLAANWYMRNGNADIKHVYEAQGAAMYTTKDGDLGEVVLSDTLTPARFKAAASVVVPLVRIAA